MSEGHLFSVNGFEYYQVGNEVYRAPLSNPLGKFGTRTGARFECYARSVQMLKQILKIEN
jgi:hypothetical protein